jgi:transposase InsO family protein
MTSKPVAFLLADLGITQSHSRPHVSDDNPYSEAQFKTLKYRPTSESGCGLVLLMPAMTVSTLAAARRATDGVRDPSRTFD